MTYRGSRRRAVLGFLKTALIACSVSSILIPFALSNPWLLIFALIPAAWLYGATSEAKTLLRERLEIDDHEIRRTPPGGPTLAFPLEEIRLVYASASAIVLVTRAGLYEIPDHFDPDRHAIVAELLRRMPWIRPLDEIVAAQRRRTDAVVREGAEARTNDGRTAAIVLFALSAVVLLKGWIAATLFLSGWFAWLGVLCLAFCRSRRERPLLIATPDWVIGSDWAAPASLIEDVSGSGDSLHIQLKDGRGFHGPWGHLDRSVREILKLRSVDREVYSEEAARILGLTLGQFFHLAEAACLRPVNPGHNRYDREDVERLRERLR